jgi:hypothetical protein
LICGKSPLAIERECDTSTSMIDVYHPPLQSSPHCWCHCRRHRRSCYRIDRVPVSPRPPRPSRRRRHRPYRIHRVPTSPCPPRPSCRRRCRPRCGSLALVATSHRICGRARCSSGTAFAVQRKEGRRGTRARGGPGVERLGVRVCLPSDNGVD